MYPNSGPTNFCSLPPEMQLNILSRLCWNDQREARRTCRHWLALIDELKDGMMTINSPESLEICKDSYFRELDRLIVRDLKAPLPISSSRRVGIPGAYTLDLRGGVSQDNVLSLMRYYLKSCNHLALSENCFQHVAKPFLVANCRTNITDFSFRMQDLAQIFGHLSEVVNENTHNAALASILRTGSFPNLKFLCQSAMASLLLASFEAFLTRHAERLEEFCLGIAGFGSLDYPTLRQLQKCRNLRTLWLMLIPTVLLPSNPLPINLPTDLTEILCDLPKLNVIDLRLITMFSAVSAAEQDLRLPFAQATNWALASLLASPERKITKLKCHCHDHADWLQHAVCLKSLTLTDCVATPNFFKPPLPGVAPSMPKLSNLEVGFQHAGNEDNTLDDWRPAFFPWLVATAPGLRYLKVTDDWKYFPTLENLQALVRGLPRLERFEFKSAQNRMQVERWQQTDVVGEWLGTFRPD